MRTRSALVLAHDTIAAAAAWYLAYWLRFNFDIPDSYTHSWLVSLAFVVPLQTAVFLALWVVPRHVALCQSVRS